MKYWILISTIVYGYLIYICTAEVNTTDKKVVIKDIMRKICNITKISLRNATPDTRPEVLKKLEAKIKKASKILGRYDNNYVEIIMQGVRGMALRNDYRICETDISEASQIEQYNFNITRKSDEISVKQQRLKDMVVKIDNLVQKSFKNAVTADEKQKVLEKLKEKILKAIKKKNIYTDSKNNSYSDLLVEGIELMMKKDNDSRRMTLEFLDNTNRDKFDDIMPDSNNPIYPNTNLNTDITTEVAVIRSLTTEQDCSSISSQICSALKELNEFICKYDDTILGLEKICDGNVDCPDGSDEQNCAKQAVDRVHKATEIMNHIGSAENCFTALIDNSMVSNQGRMLSEVLETEVNFIKKYTESNPNFDPKAKIEEYNHRSVLDISNEVAVILRTFVLALNGALCTDLYDDKIDLIVDKYSESLDRALDELPDDPKFVLKLCDCKEQFCVNSSCIAACKRVCYQRYTLNRLNCPATNGEKTVSLDLLCDGKFDCFDETDEHGCVLYNTAARFEASGVFDNILKTIKTKTMSNDFESARNKLITLHEAIKTIQKCSMDPRIKDETFKALRNKCFGLLNSVYDEVLNTIQVDSRAEEVYEFLQSIKEKLVIALKKSNTGNERIIAPDGCFCRGVVCALPVCSKSCIRICAAKPRLTRYGCNGTTEADAPSVSIEAICNGKSNCPHGEDELNCKKDLCRNHHLVLLRRNLQKVGDKHAGTVLGEVLKSWKEKVLSMLLLAEKRDRPTLNSFKELVGEMLTDLVATYVSLDDYRKTNNEHILKKFEKLAQRILETLKSCGK